VVGQVLRRTRFRRPPLLDVGYPGPRQDGPFRARLAAGFTLAQEGQPITVYVNPDDPNDVSLGPGGYSRVWAVLLGVWGFMCAVFAVRLLAL